MAIRHSKTCHAECCKLVVKNFIKWLMEDSGHEITVQPNQSNGYSKGIALRNTRDNPMHYPEVIGERFFREQPETPYKTPAKQDTK